MMRRQSTLDFGSFERLAKSLKRGKSYASSELARAMTAIGKSDLKKLRDEQMRGGNYLSVKFKGFRNMFKAKLKRAQRPSLAHDLQEYTGWKAAAIFEKGGTVRSKGKLMPIFFTRGMQRKYGGKKLAQNFQRGYIAALKSKRRPGRLFIAEINRGTKSDRPKYIGVFVRSYYQKKRLDFFANHDNNRNAQEQILAKAGERVLRYVARLDAGKVVANG